MSIDTTIVRKGMMMPMTELPGLAAWQITQALESSGYSGRKTLLPRRLPGFFLEHASQENHPLAKRGVAFVKREIHHPMTQQTGEFSYLTGRVYDAYLQRFNSPKPLSLLSGERPVVSGFASTVGEGLGKLLRESSAEIPGIIVAKVNAVTGNWDLYALNR